MNKQEILKQIHDFIDMAMEIEETGRASVVVKYHSVAKAVNVQIYDIGIKNTLFNETCYLDWENDCSFGVDVMFPIFREKLQELIIEKAVC